MRLKAHSMADILYEALHKLSLGLKSCDVQMSKLNNAMNLLPGDLLLIPSCVYNGESDYKVEIGQIIEHLAEVIEKVPARRNVETGEMETK